MSYATPDDVKGLFRNFPSNTDAAVDDDKIQKWLDSANAKVVGKIGTLYQMPITVELHPLACLMLAEIETFFVASIIDDVLNTYSEADKKPGWEKRAQMALRDLIPEKTSDGKQPEPTTKLPDAVYLGTKLQTSGIKVSSTNESIFKKGVDSW